MERLTYTPKGKFIEGSRNSITRQMFQELLLSHELVRQLFFRDFKARYRQSALGAIWAVIMPLIMIGLFVGMNRSGVLTIHDVGMPYPLYAIIGLTIWGLFSGGLSACTNSLVTAGNMIAKINFPKVALILAASAQGLIDTLIRLTLIAGAFLYFGVTPHWVGVIIGLLSLIPVYLLMVGLGFVTSLIAGIFRDVINILNLALIGLMLLTPILYPIGGNGVLGGFNRWNLFNYLINVPREFIVFGQSRFVVEFLLSALFSVIIFSIAWRLFYLSQTRIAERI